ncbi:cytochrome P450 [Gordonia sinesedis]
MMDIRTPTSFSDENVCGDIVFDETSQAWLVTRYATVRSILAGDGWSSDPTTSAAVRRALAELGLTESPISRTMLGMDPPDHTRVRDSVRDVFTPRYIAQLGDGIAAIADDIIGHPDTGAVIDFMDVVARPFPIAVIAEWLALDVDTTQILWDEAGALVRVLDTTTTPGTDMRSAVAGFTSLTAALLPTAVERRTAPGDDLLSLLASDERLDLDEVVVNAILLAVAGHETTAKLLGNSMIRLLAESPDGRLIDRLDLADPAVADELLRLDGPARMIVRAATCRHTVDGAMIEPGDRVIMLADAANRDPEVFDEPDRLRPDRNGPPHLAFGHGRHRCLGAALARLEIGSALPLVARRAPRAAGSVTWGADVALYGPERMPMVFEEDLG